MSQDTEQPLTDAKKILVDSGEKLRRMFIDTFANSEGLIVDVDGATYTITQLLQDPDLFARVTGVTNTCTKV